MKVFLAGGISGNLSKKWKEISQIYKVIKDESMYCCSARKPFTIMHGGVKRIDNQVDKIINLSLMKMFLVEGTLKKHQKLRDKIMKIHIADPLSRHEIVDELKSIAEGENENKNLKEIFPTKEPFKHLNILESFFYIRKTEEFMQLVKHFGCFLLDSGAFTFMSGSSQSVNWDEYVEEYAKFINKHDVKYFFELDIDSIVGLKEVERLRAKLEDLTGKKPIPVWHKSRGKEYFIKMCENYPYVALGGIVTKEIPRKIYEQAFPWFIEQAHKRGVKIHGLGYTTISNLKKYHFDSVDSTAWLYGNRGGYIYKFNPNTGLMEQLTKEGCRLKTNEGAVNNFNEWVKLSIYAERNW